jgi:hypothetical protein
VSDVPRPDPDCAKECRDACQKPGAYTECPRPGCSACALADPDNCGGHYSYLHYETTTVDESEVEAW